MCWLSRKPVRALSNIAAAGKGPYILEMKTYRYRGHSMSDPAKYRTKEEVDAMREQHDPDRAASRCAAEAGIIDEDALKAIDKDVKAIVSDAAEFAKDLPRAVIRQSFGPTFWRVGG